MELNLSLRAALVSGWFEMRGSWMKVLPAIEFGGMDPEVMVRRLSMIVVFPAPFCPSISVKGLSNSIFCSSVGLKARMPLMVSLSIELISVLVQISFQSFISLTN